MSNCTNNNRSIIRRGGRPDSNKPRRLFCLPPAGAGPSLYFPWLDLEPDDIEICPISLPGKEDRMREPLAESVQSLAKSIAADLIDYLDKPYALFGYSMGALLSYEVALLFKLLGQPTPDYFITLGARAPNTEFNFEQPLHQLEKENFRRTLIEIGGTPKEIIENEDAMAIFEPVLRNDFRISETYRRDTVLPLDCPIQAIHCRDDVLIEKSQVTRWNQYTNNRFYIEELNEPHIISKDILVSLPKKISTRWQA
ncbi:MAG: thioesterase domain-containing protein [Pseudomonadales bacterium]|nr:thioesterase domain-containing protein [Pseudomonadales bacterium]